MSTLPLAFITDLHVSLDAEVATINARTAAKPRRLTWTAVTKEARAMGWTVRATGWDKERVAYPLGTSQNHWTAIFISDPEDMLGTVKATVKATQDSLDMSRAHGFKAGFDKASEHLGDVVPDMWINRENHTPEPDASPEECCHADAWNAGFADGARMATETARENIPGLTNTLPINQRHQLRNDMGQWGRPIRDDADWGIMFAIDGVDVCREMGRDHGFNSYDTAIAWLRTAAHTKWHRITSFYVFAW
jgi:hypothetical protein